MQVRFTTSRYSVVHIESLDGCSFFPKMETSNMQNNWSALVHRYMSQNIESDQHLKNPAITQTPGVVRNRSIRMKAQPPVMALLVSLWVAGMGTAVAATPLHVAYAGSMGAVMDMHLGPAFAKTHHVTYQGEGQGAYGLAHLIAPISAAPPATVLLQSSVPAGRRRPQRFACRQGA